MYPYRHSHYGRDNRVPRNHVGFLPHRHATQTHPQHLHSHEYGHVFQSHPVAHRFAPQRFSGHAHFANHGQPVRHINELPRGVQLPVHVNHTIPSHGLGGDAIFHPHVHAQPLPSVINAGHPVFHSVSGGHIRHFSSGIVSQSRPRKAHVKARGLNDDGESVAYPGDGPQKGSVPDDKVSWAISFDDYAPVTHTAGAVAKGPVWADKEETDGINFNTIEGKVDRTSFEGNYNVIDGKPQNPRGRTGMNGRGLLGRWGPNHAADPIVTRWHGEGADRKLQFVAIHRNDGGGWAIPGGMVEAGDTVSATLAKEFGEEAMNSMAASPEQAKKIEDYIQSLFKGGQVVYKGYVDDPRNTDNSWMETVAMHFHLADPTVAQTISLTAGDDAGAVAWTDIGPDLKLYASHRDFVATVARRMGVPM